MVIAVLLLPVRLLLVYLSDCFCLCLHISETTWSNCSTFLAHNCGHGSVLWWLCNTLCTSTFVDDVMFSHSGPDGTSCVFLNITAETTATIPTKFCLTIKTCKYSLWVVHGGKVCYQRTDCQAELTSVVVYIPSSIDHLDMVTRPGTGYQVWCRPVEQEVNERDYYSYDCNRFTAHWT